MKICIPALGDGMDARLSDHFGSAPCFILYDREQASCEMVQNTKASHAHGQCRPLELLADRGIAAVICKGMGRNAAAAVEAAGIRLFVTRGLTVREALDAFQAGELIRLDPAAACMGRQDHGAHIP